MWSFRNVLRNFGYRLKNHANGNTAGVQSTKEGRSEFEEEYKHIWTSSLRTSDLTLKPSHHEARSYGFLYANARHSGSDGGGQQHESRERPDWDASKVTPSRTWLEALGWGAVLGLGLNILHLKQEELFRQKCPVEVLTSSGIPQKWLTSVCALSMPLDQSPLIKAVLPAGNYHKRRDSISETATASTSEISNDSVCSDVSEDERPAYSSEASVLLKSARDRLSSLARDYVGELEYLLGLSARDDPFDDRRSVAQEQYNLGLCHELGIGVPRSSDQAMKHYVEAALLDHPVAIQNLISLHKYTLPSSQTIHRSASSPVLSPGSSEAFFSDQKVKPGPQKKSVPSGKFWSDEASDSDSGAGFSRSSSFPDLPNLVTCK